jgi:hypothetical protein
MTLVYVAKKLREALRLEECLATAGFDYVVEPDRFLVGLLCRREGIGAFFYVSLDRADAARDAMGRDGFAPYEE